MNCVTMTIFYLLALIQFKIINILVNIVNQM